VPYDLDEDNHQSRSQVKKRATIRKNLDVQRMRGCAAESPLGNKDLNEDEADWHSNARSGGRVYRMV
jgi:hypothetical protein